MRRCGHFGRRLNVSRAASVAHVVAAQRRLAGHQQRPPSLDDARDRPERQRSHPELGAARSIHRPQNVVERDEVHPTFIGHWRSNRIAARSPFPVDATVFRDETVKEIVRCADEESIVERQDLVCCATELAFPRGFTGLDRERHDSPVGGRNIDAVGGERGRGVRQRSEVVRPDEQAVRCAICMHLPVAGRHHEPPDIPDRTLHSFFA